MFNSIITLERLQEALIQTIYMVSVALLIGSAIGLLLGIVLVVTRPDGLSANKIVYNVLNPIVNIFRSIPFVILMVAILPFTRLIVHTSIGTSAAIVPLIFYCAPYIARLVENSLLDIKPGIIEAANSMGASTFQTIWYFLLPEARSSLVLTFTTATIGLIGATAMAGAVGGGGIGDLAISYGYQRFDTLTVVITVVILIVIVQVIQSLGHYFAHRLRKG